jgi:hypothetical protein
MKISRLKAARLHYEAKAAEAEETIKVYLTNAAGIGEHPQVMEELRGQIEILTDSKDVMLVIDELIEKFTNEKGVN